ncbi:C-type lectin domain family 7 member A-like isoform X3 [Acipenser ruthenus]|uniref:C-type lectin domain family 7 member A-like isoform X3 n=1 Tax=Acipenser ruthenus TaxID=7906 RepID=UPI00155FA658|nr:C-type lectin domain family 7 member A-like isoform X3 [Acipenser ruthenus]
MEMKDVYTGLQHTSVDVYQTVSKPEDEKIEKQQSGPTPEAPSTEMDTRYTSLQKPPENIYATANPPKDGGKEEPPSDTSAEAPSTEMDTRYTSLQKPPENIYATANPPKDGGKEEPPSDTSAEAPSTEMDTGYSSLQKPPENIYATANPPKDEGKEEPPSDTSAAPSTEMDTGYSSLQKPPENIYATANPPKDEGKEKPLSPAGGKEAFYKKTSLLLAVICCLLVFIIIGLSFLCSRTSRGNGLHSSPIPVDPEQEEKVDEVNKGLPTHSSFTGNCSDMESLFFEVVLGSNITKNCNSQMCELCLKGWVLFNHKCYMFSKDIMPWNASQAQCRSKGGDLVKIQSEEEQKFISRIIQKRGGFYFWIGLTDQVGKGEWRWVDNTPLTKGYWRQGIPSTIDVTQCAGMGPQSSSLNWDKSACTAYSRRICESAVMHLINKANNDDNLARV